jgi:hypothetical protein
MTKTKKDLKELRLKATKLSHKKASDLEHKLNTEEEDGWFYSMETTDHEKQFVIAVYDEYDEFLGFL